MAGRWSSDSVTFLEQLAEHNARSVPALLRKAARLLFFQHWTGLLACAVQRAYANTRLEKLLQNSACLNGSLV